MTVDLRCAQQARDRDTSPTGTALAARVHVLVDTPLPWPSDLSATPLHRAVAAAAGPGARIHGVVPEPIPPRSPDVGDDRRRVVVHGAGEGPFTEYRRHVATARPDAVPRMVRAMLAGAHEQPGTDVLVCGHGARDRCCGSMGTALALLADLGAATTVWRSGHLGGHRFAPTAVVLPSGTAWAWLDQALLATIVERSRPPAELLGHYRGSTAVVHPAGQVAEAAVLSLVGWSWLDGPRTVEVVDGPAGAFGAEPIGEATRQARRLLRRSRTAFARDGRTYPLKPLEWEVLVTGSGAAWRGRVREIGRIPQPVCGSDEPGRKDDPVLQLVELRPEASS